MQGFKPIIDDSGKITGYTTNIGGADTVFPFRVQEAITISISGTSKNYEIGSRAINAGEVFLYINGKQIARIYADSKNRGDGKWVMSYSHTYQPE